MRSESLLVVPAQERVDRLSFSGAAEVQDHQIHVGTYRCPHCGAVANFNTGTLRKAEGYDGSPLGRGWHDRCQEARPLGPWAWPLDFRCSGCGCAVRILFAADTEFAMGAHSHKLLQVLEEPRCSVTSVR